MKSTILVVLETPSSSAAVADYSEREGIPAVAFAFADITAADVTAADVTAAADNAAGSIDHPSVLCHGFVLLVYSM